MPRLLDINEKVDAGESLLNEDLDFLENAIVDARKAIPLIDRHPEWHSFCSYVTHLYETVTEKALENEKGL